MTKYSNLNGNSGVHSYSIDMSSITVQFNDGGMYLYNGIKPGASYVQQMKALALRGKGLNSLISKEIKKNYYSKLR